jgi:Putative auto-transporter adhesin, head GIN domain
MRPFHTQEPRMSTDIARRSLVRLALPALVAVATALPVMAQAQRLTGSGRVATETRTLPAFQGVALSGSMDLIVRQGGTQAVQVQADDNLMPYLETEVTGSGADAKLQVRWKRGVSIYNSSATRISVTVPKLTSLAASGSGDMTVEPFETPSLVVSVSGSSDTRLQKLVTAELQISISGSGDVDGAGSATRLRIDVAGSGDVKLRDMKSDDVKISIAGSGDASVHADKSLEVRIAGSGDVVYTGNAATVNAKVAGSGSVNKR